MQDIIKKIVDNITAPIDTEAGALNNIPNFVIAWSIFMSVNAIFQAFADLIIEMLILMEVVAFKIPLRIEFLCLTLISTVIAYLTLKSMRNGEMDVTQNTLLVGFFVESSLVLGDVYLLFNTTKDFWIIFLIRLPFMLLTSSNIAAIYYMMNRADRIRRARPNPRF